MKQVRSQNYSRRFRRLTGAFLVTIGLLFIGQPAFALERWQAELARMPLRTNVTELTKTNCIPLMLASFEAGKTAKALIFMPGATDEFYFFNRGHAKLPNDHASMLDAVTALTNQTLIRATFRAPFVLIHTAEDPLEPLYKIEDRGMAKKLRRLNFSKHVSFFDVDWDYLLPLLTAQGKTKFLPERYSRDSWHFYRHSYAAWNLTVWEALEATALAGKTTFTVQKDGIVFAGDTRFRARPPVPENLDFLSPVGR